MITGQYLATGDDGVACHELVARGNEMSGSVTILEVVV